MTTLPPSQNHSFDLRVRVGQPAPKDVGPSSGGRQAGSQENIGAGNEARTRDLNLGKVALYQLSYSRAGKGGILSPLERKSR
jgi:hypothetical protein